jgi:hypothetical protein
MPRTKPAAVQPQFSLFVAEHFRDHGIARAASTREALLDEARAIAVRICKTRGEVTYDDVYLEMLERGLKPENIGNAAGSLFRGSQFRFTGRWSKSTRVSNHARVNRVWRLDEPKSGVQ